MGRQKQKQRVIPEQDRKICGTICVCQMTMVLSCVSFVYLGVAIYLPSHKAFNVGIDPTPVTCHTVDNTLSKNCTWASCGEWCLTKHTGICPQFYASVRQNGTDIVLKNCTRLTNVACPPADEDSVKRYNCNNDIVCRNLTGIFKCRLGHCSNMSEIYDCQHKTENGIVINSGEDNLKLNGIFDCVRARCLLIKQPLTCDRYCNKITTSNVNVYLRHDDNIFTGECEQTIAYNKANGTSPPINVNQTIIWSKGAVPNQVILASCSKVFRIGSNQLEARDCINGTIIDENVIPQPFMNFTQFWSIYHNSVITLDAEQKYLPMQNQLVIHNSSRLYINLEGCVNTLRNECKEFVRTYGKNGTGKTAESRFLCYHNKNDSLFVLARFDLNKVWMELMISVCVPGTLFIMSFVTLLIITQTVKVGDDARMRCKWWLCNDNNNDAKLDDSKVTFFDNDNRDDDDNQQNSLAMENFIATDQQDDVDKEKSNRK